MTTVRERYYADMRAIGLEQDPARLAAEVEQLRAELRERDAQVERRISEAVIAALDAVALEIGKEAKEAGRHPRAEGLWRAAQFPLLKANELRALLTPDATKEPVR